MSKDVRISLTTDVILACAEKVGIKQKEALSLISLLLIEYGKSKSETRKIRKPKLSSVTNPKSKYYDATPHLTKRIAIIWYSHQMGKKRYKHKRITDTDRQWVLLVQIKQHIISAVGRQRLLPMVKKVFEEGERLAQQRNKNHIYLTNILSWIEEILDRILDRESSVITVKEYRVYRAYKKYRKRVTGKEVHELDPGSEAHRNIGIIVEILRKYKIKARVFMEIQFRAFAHFGTFPLIKDLVTEKAIDRLEQGLAQDRDWNEVTEEDKEYWDDVRNRTDK